MTVYLLPHSLQKEKYTSHDILLLHTDAHVISHRLNKKIGVSYIQLVMNQIQIIYTAATSCIHVTTCTS